MGRQWQALNARPAHAVPVPWQLISNVVSAFNIEATWGTGHAAKPWSQLHDTFLSFQSQCSYTPFAASPQPCE